LIKFGIGVDLGVVVFISFDTAIDIEVDGYQHAERLILIFDFNLFGLTVMVEQFYSFSDQGDWSLKQPSVEGDCAVFVDLSASHFAKVVVEVIWSGPQTVQVGRKALKGALPGAAVLSLIVNVSQPAIKGFIELI
jgi:hypothetical protein